MKETTETETRAGSARVSALLTLLQDENLKVASLAMEQFLKLGKITEETIAEYQESHDPHLRCRIHQLSSILSRRRARREFIDALNKEQVSVWDGVLQINTLYDQRCKTQVVRTMLSEMAESLKSEDITTPRIAALMRDQEFAVPEEDMQDVDLYLIQRVVETRFGSPAVLCALAQEVSRQADWGLTIVLHSGRFCLIDRHHLLVDPSEGWHMSKLRADDKIHPCGRRDVLLGILSQLFLTALIEGHLRDLYHFGDLLTALNGRTVDELPYPLGGETPHGDG